MPYTFTQTPIDKLIKQNEMTRRIEKKLKYKITTIKIVWYDTTKKIKINSDAYTQKNEKNIMDAFK